MLLKALWVNCPFASRAYFQTPAPFMHDYPRAASRGFSLSWLLAITNSFVWLKAMQERNLCSQGRTWQKCMQTSFRFLYVSSNQEHNGSCSNLIPRALFPGFGGGPVKSALATRLCFLKLTQKRGLFLYKIRDIISTPYWWLSGDEVRLDTSPHTLRSATVFSPVFSGERDLAETYKEGTIAG